MQSNSKSLLLNSRAGVNSARKTLAPIQPEVLRNKDLIVKMDSEPSDMPIERDTRYSTSNSRTSAFNTAKDGFTASLLAP